VSERQDECVDETMGFGGELKPIFGRRCWHSNSTARCAGPVAEKTDRAWSSVARNTRGSGGGGWRLQGQKNRTWLSLGGRW
jgi:hypothetical protein